MRLKLDREAYDLAPKVSRRIVIDASIARACGPELATHPLSKNCRDFLLAVRKMKHRMVFSAAVSAEWDKHQSRFAKEWRVSMRARKSVCVVEPAGDTELRERIWQTARDSGCVAIMQKDIHLVEAARETDQTISALDDAARGHFAHASATVLELASIVWVNPANHKEELVKWLAAGAKAEPERQLGFAPESR